MGQFSPRPFWAIKGARTLCSLGSSPPVLADSSRLLVVNPFRHEGVISSNIASAYEMPVFKHYVSSHVNDGISPSPTALLVYFFWYFTPTPPLKFVKRDCAEAIRVKEVGGKMKEDVL